MVWSAYYELFDSSVTLIFDQFLYSERLWHVLLSEMIDCCKHLTFILRVFNFSTFVHLRVRSCLLPQMGILLRYNKLKRHIEIIICRSLSWGRNVQVIEKPRAILVRLSTLTSRSSKSFPTQRSFIYIHRTKFHTDF